LATGVTKQLVYQSLGESDRLAAMTRETSLTWWAGTQPDTAEGVMAMMERRPPKWVGSKHTPYPPEVG